MVLKTCAENSKIFAEKYVTEFTAKDVTVPRVAIFLNEALHQIYFLELYKISAQIWTAKYDLNKE